MNALDLVWHLGNLLAPAVGTALLAVLLAKTLWRRALKTVGWTRLLQWAVLAGWAGMLAGWLWTGRDGKLMVHALMSAGIALGVWWAGFLRPAR